MTEIFIYKNIHKKSIIQIVSKVSRIEAVDSVFIARHQYGVYLAYKLLFRISHSERIA